MKVFKFFGVFLLIVFLAFLSASSYYLYTQVNILKGKSGETRIIEKFDGNTTNVVTSSDCGSECEKIIDEKVKEAVAEAITNIPTPTSSTKTTSTQKATQTSYVPLGTTSSSTSTGWYTVEDTSSFIDLKNDFNDKAYVTFEASLKVAYGNGQAFARLWDDTNKIAVDGSEISTTGNSDYQYMKSGRIYLWNGNNNYKVQLRSLNGYEVTITSAKVKLVY